MKHTDLYFCLSSLRPEMVFETREQADGFILDNGGEVVDGLGTVPVRSCYCPGCGGWHVVGDPSEDSSEEMACNEEEDCTPQVKPAKTEAQKAYYRAMNARFSSSVEKARMLMSACRVDEAESTLEEVLGEIHRRFGEHPGWRQTSELKEEAETCLSLIARFKDTSGNPEAEEAVLGCEPGKRDEFLFWKMVYNGVLVRDIERGFSEVEDLLEQQRENEAKVVLDDVRKLIYRTKGNGALLLRPSMKARFDALKARLEEEKQSLARLAMSIEKAKGLMSIGRTDEAGMELAGILCELERLRNVKGACPKSAELEERAGACLSLIARFGETVGNPEAEKAAMDSEAGTVMDDLFRRMVTNTVVVRETGRLFTEMEHLVDEERGREAQGKAEEIKAWVKRLEGPGTSRLRASLKDRLFPLEMDVDDLLGEEKGLEKEQRHFLLKAIDRATLADSARKDGNELLFKNFVTEAKLFLARVDECEERETVESFLLALGA